MNITKEDYNIEYAHIYTDKKFGAEQRQGIKILHDIIKKLRLLNKSYVLSVLIDEYNPKDRILDIGKFLVTLEKYGARPDFVAFESKLAPYHELLLKKMTARKRREYVKYIEKNNKIPCSLLIAIWHLKRLGVIETPPEELKYFSKNPKKLFIANKTITILPKGYQEVEKRGREIIASTNFKNCLDDMENVYFENDIKILKK